jgi:shikimate kinase
VTGDRQIRNIALIGFMGSGKSSVGRLVASLLDFDFLDTDEWIEQRTGRRITEIFEQQGEPAFRELERQAVAELAAHQRTVISTGGGLAAHAGNLASLKAHALVVCLWAGAETLWSRVQHQTHRPLLHDPDPLGRVRNLLAEREPFYRQADLLLNTEHRPVKDLAHHIVHEFRALGRDGAPA